jgi:hypothetical protein
MTSKSDTDGVSIHVKDMGRDITNYGLPELDA